MKEQLINFETAKLAKEKGFNEYCLSFYGLNSITNEIDLYDCSNNCKGHKNSNNPISVSAPTQSLLQKWLREKHKLHVHCFPYGDKVHYQYSLSDIQNDPDLSRVDRLVFRSYQKRADRKYPSYEDALETALQEALKQIN